MVNWQSKKLGDVLGLCNVLALLVLLNLVSSFYFFRIDLTEEKRYTIKAPTKEMLGRLDDEVYVEVFLAGDLNAGFTRLQKSVREILEEFRVYSANRVRYTFTNPTAARSQQAQAEFARDLAARGVQMLPVIENRDGERIEKVVFPGAIVSYGGMETGVMLFKGNRAQNAQEVLNQSVEGLEYELASAIARLSSEERKSVTLLTGHGEIDSLQIGSLRAALDEMYDVARVDISEVRQLPQTDVTILAKPVFTFSESDKLKLDQYLMRGGRLLLFIDRLDARMDSASRPDYFAFAYETGLEDQLFRYGLRVNPNLVQDAVAAKYPVVTGKVGNQPQIMQMDWPFFPLANGNPDHIITRNLDRSLARFASAIDTVKALGVKKTPLLFTSPYARSITAPVKVSVNDLRGKLDPSQFNAGPLPLAWLLEGTFTSLYRNRFLPAGAVQTDFLEQSVATKIIVVADGDFVKNDVNPRNGQVQQLGLDPFSGYTFANQDVVLNMVSYLADDGGLINTRSKEVKIRPLDRQKIREGKVYWQMLNIGLPLVALVVFGLVRAWYRRRKYARFA
ncbi:MAG: gliding motility-associated ABC transporter substrate-binding protein GldG [Bacteroidota bacterium]